MANVLITTLGKARPSNDRQNVHGRYRTLRYDFGEGKISAPTAFFGKALFDYLSDKGIAIDKIVILGTSGSMWDAWLEVYDTAQMFFDNEKLATELQRKVEVDDVSPDQLSTLSRILSQNLYVETLCRLIPYGIDTSEQLEMIQVISKSADPGDTVYMDVTHGLRHLPMLEMLSAFMMHPRFETRSLFYGAAERQQKGIAPTITLDGALRINDWICAIAILKKTGNVTALANLPGMETLRDSLLKCQFYEQMNDVVQARRNAKKIVEHLDDIPAEGQLFRQEIREIFEWGNKSILAIRQFSQAQKAFDNHDYMRSVILFFETVVSSELKEDAQNPEKRKTVQERLNKECGDEWYILRRLRNSLAHSETPTGRCADKVIKMRKDEEEFVNGMKPLIEWVRKRLPKIDSR